MLGLSRGRILVVALILPLLAVACTANPTAGPDVVVTQTVPGTGEPQSASNNGGPSNSGGPSATGGPTASGGPTSGGSTPSGGPTSVGGSTSTSGPAVPTTGSSTTAPSPVVIPAPRITFTPANAATGVSPIAPVVVKAQNGAFSKVAVTNSEGRAVKGTLSADKTSWTSSEPLGYGRKYAIAATASTTTGRQSTSNSAFTTLKPATTIYPSFFPNPSMKTVGVGQPMVVIFDKAPADKVAAEKALTVKTVPAVAGAWYWWDDRTLHYRAKDYWKSGTKITVSANIYGVNLGGGAYGETDRTMTLTIGPSKIAKVDDATKQMEVFIDGKKVKTYPVSLGRNKQITVGGTNISFVTPSGIYVGQEKYVVKQMSSATYGLPVDSSLGYDSKIPLAVRFSNEGIFVHSAPWSVADQGIRNVSHGCINLPPAGGKWFYDNFGYGDILTVKGTSTKLAPTDGFGDWNLSWAQWLRGSALN